ncbi:MAG: SRPBCC domain-containing protein [Leptospiraceae bacterium]|nr:SRPBCC domain-containing protein [Leptospiraceae bacterium]
MQEKHTSTISIDISATPDSIWETLTNPAKARELFWGATISTTWEEGSPITFTGEYKGNSYLEKGTILESRPPEKLRYSHWSNLEGLEDTPENYRTWSFSIRQDKFQTVLTVSEDNIPTEKQRIRSDEFWTEVLRTVKRLAE